MKLMYVLMDLLDYETYYSGEALRDPLDTAKIYDISTPEKEIAAKLQALKDEKDFLSDLVWQGKAYLVDPGEEPIEPSIKVSDIAAQKAKVTKMVTKYETDLANWNKRRAEADVVNAKVVEMLNNSDVVYPEVVEEMWKKFLNRNSDSWATSQVHYYEIN